MDGIEGWHDLYVMLGGSAAALIGLLFVAVSVHVSYFVDSRAEHVVAAALHVLVSYLFVLMLSVCVLIPEESALWLGGELAALALAYLAWTWRLFGTVTHADLSHGPTTSEWTWLLIGAATCGAGVLIAGLGLAHGGAGAWFLYLLPAACSLLLFNGVWVSWQLVLRLPVDMPK